MWGIASRSEASHHFGGLPHLYPRWDGPATVREVRRAVQNMVNEAHGPNDRLVFVTSSHGSGDGQGNSFLCLLPDPMVGVTPSERSGQYWDHELASDLSAGGRTVAQTFVFLDA